MIDIFLEWGGDIAAGAGGDVAVADGADMQRQRVCRRLLTNAGDYIRNLDYGGGLGQFVGRPASPPEIEAVVRSQLALEAAIPQSPAPEVSTTIGDMAAGAVTTTIAIPDMWGFPATSFAVTSG